jgi:dipeptidyl aminopeptidase/acylaminoacyl peptidase
VSVRRLVLVLGVAGIPLVAPYDAPKASREQSPAAPTGRIAYEVSRGKRGWLEVARLDGTARRRLTPLPGPRSDRNDVDATWSPDGRRIAFVRFHARGRSREALYVVGADGRGLRRIGPGGWGADGTSPTWSRDSRSIAFAGPAPACYPWKAQGVPLYVAAANGSGRRRLSVVARTTVSTYAGPADWSPDGRMLLYVVHRFSEHDCLAYKLIDSVLSRMRINGTMRARVDDRDVGEAKWSPDAQNIAFVSTVGNMNACAVSVRAASGGPARELARPDWVEEGCPYAPHVFAWLPPGREIVVAEGTSVAAFDVQTGQWRAIVRTARQRCLGGLDYPCENRIVAVSGDGQYLAVQELPHEEPNIAGRLYIVRSDGTQQWNLPYPRTGSFAIFLNPGA